MMFFSPRTIGKAGEKAAARYLRRNGYRIVGRNVHCGKKELDLIAKNRAVLAFVEVKTRTFETEEAALDARPCRAVNAEKRRRTLDAAYAYLHAHPTALAPRVDVIEIYYLKGSRKPFKICHIPAAVDARGHAR